MRRLHLLLALLFCCSSAHASDTLRLYYAFNSTAIGQDQRHKTDAFLRKYQDKRRISLRIFGFADEPGNDSVNTIVAERRAKALAEYLLDKGYSPDQIKVCKGLGNIAANGLSRIDRRVDLVVVGPGSRHSSTGKRTDSFECGRVFVLEDLKFAVSRSEFLPASMPTLRRLSEMLANDEEVNVRIEGHICCGNKADSSRDVWYALSVERARAVYEYLIAHGISRDRLSFRGYGFQKPRVYPEITEQDRAMNRRVEVRVVCREEVTR